MSKPGKPMSLFPDHPQTFTKPEPRVIEPEEALVGAAEAELHEVFESEPDSYNGRSHGGNGGNGHSIRNRVPLFSEDDRTIPAYIRRLDDKM